MVRHFNRRFSSFVKTSSSYFLKCSGNDPPKKSHVQVRPAGSSRILIICSNKSIVSWALRKNMNKLRDIVLFKPLLYDSGKKLSTTSSSYVNRNNHCHSRYYRYNFRCIDWLWKLWPHKKYFPHSLLTPPASENNGWWLGLGSNELECPADETWGWVLRTIWS